MRRFAVSVLAVIVLVSVAPYAQETERQFKAAMNTELVDGNLKSAIDQYKKVAASGNRALASQALVRMAECYQKLGDAEAQKIYERLVREYADQGEAATLARNRLSRALSPAISTGMVNRRVWAPGANPSFGTVSADGRSLSFTNWSTGDLFIHDFTTGRDRQVTNKGSFAQSNSFAEESAISRDGRQVAYSWWGTFDGKSNYELRVASLAGNSLPESRVLVRNDDIGWLMPHDWSPDGSWILVQIARVDRTAQLGLVAVKDGSLRVLKSTNWRGASEAFFSPDGKYVAFDSPAGDAQPNDVYVLASDGSRETPAVVSASHDLLIGWSPDGRQLLFASDRGGASGLWAQPMLDGRPQGSARLIKPDLAPEPLGVTSTGTFYLRASAGEQDLLVANVDFRTGQVNGVPASPVQRYVGTNRSPAWSRDGKNLAYVSLRSRVGGNREVFLVIHSVDTGETRDFDVPKLNYFQMPKWEPDGRALIARGGHINGKGGIHRIDARTGDVETIAEPGVGAEESIDGKLYYRTFDPAKSQSAFVEHNLATGAKREVFSAGNLGLPKISPDGRTLAATVDDLSRRISTLLLIPINGGQPREVAQLSAPQADTALEWTPDGRALLVKKATNDAKEELWVVPIDGSPHVKIKLSGPFGNDFAIHPDGRRLAYLAGEGKGEVWVLENFLPSISAGTGSN